MTEQNPAIHRAQVEAVTRLLAIDEALLRARSVEALGVGAGQTVLDLGAGPGCGVPAILASVGVSGRVLAMDRSPAMIAALETRFADDRRVIVQQADAERLPIPDGVLDAVLLAGVLQQLADPRAVLVECARVTRRGGRVVLVNKGMAPWRAGDTWYAGALAVLGREAVAWPPLDLLPPCASDVVVTWLPGDAFYLLRFTVGERS